MEETVDTETRLHPIWRELGEYIEEHSEGWEIMDSEIAARLEVERSSQMYGLLLMRCKQYLLDRYGVVLTRVRDEDSAARGYRIATDAEKVEIHGQRKWRSMKAALAGQVRVLASVDTTKITPEQATSRDRQLMRAGMVQAVLRQRPPAELDAGNGGLQPRPGLPSGL